MNFTRVTLMAAGGAVTLAAVALFAYALARARVPQHRAALEDLVRVETGLDVRFSELGLRWGWYGPEAVFRGVELGEPGQGGVLLRAPELVVGFDLWRMLRSGQLQAGRITLVDPDIDLVRAAQIARLPSAAHAPAPARESPLTMGARILAHWRGTRIDLEGGTLRSPAAGGAAAPLTVAIRRIALRRSGPEWTADAQLRLPASLGDTAHLVLSFKGAPGRPADLSGSLQVSGERLEFAGWRAALPWASGAV
ncbi:MAG: hypothetical protein ACRETP_02165, partial [Steroidobacteraceae bacterium]